MTSFITDTQIDEDFYQYTIQYPTYTDIENYMTSIADGIKGQGILYDYIIGVSRGGLIPAVMLSHKLGVRLLPVDYSSAKGAGDNVGSHLETSLDHSSVDLEGKSILIVDDIYDTGHTIRDLVSHYIAGGTDSIDTAVIYYKTQPDTMHLPPPFTPNFYAINIPENAPFIYFPWEIE